MNNVKYNLLTDCPLFRGKVKYPEAMKNKWGQFPFEKNYECYAHVYENRWEKLDKSFSELQRKHLSAQVEWGSEYQDVIVPLLKCRGELLITLQEFLERKKNPYDAEPRTKEDRSEERDVMYYFPDSNDWDNFTIEINEAVAKFEVWLRPYISKR